MNRWRAGLVFLPLMILACRGPGGVARATGGAELDGGNASTERTFPDGGTVADDAGADGGRCVYIDLSKFDRSCQADSDCIAITPGLICNHLCGGGAINRGAQARYNKAIAPIIQQPGWGSSCPSLGKARCLPGSSSRLCTWCPSRPSIDPVPPGCLDAQLAAWASVVAAGAACRRFLTWSVRQVQRKGWASAFQ